MNKPQIQSLPYVLITDVLMWCVFSHPVFTIESGKLKSTSIRSVCTQKFCWPKKYKFNL